MFGLDLMNKKAFTYTMVAKIGCLLPGTAIYAVSFPFSPYKRKLILIHMVRKIRFPESCWPGRFDMCSSHSFMHILVVCAAIIQMIGYLEAFDYAYSHITCSAS
jgi:adiponectin receptor